MQATDSSRSLCNSRRRNSNKSDRLENKITIINSHYRKMRCILVTILFIFISLANVCLSSPVHSQQQQNHASCKFFIWKLQ